MILPATSGAVLFLCLLVFVCCGSWFLPWRIAAKRLRFEIFAIDAALGISLFALLAAFTLGSMGSELAFTDSLLVSGHRAQASLLACGLLLGLGNVALIAAVGVGGVAVGFPVAGAIIALVLPWTAGMHHFTHLLVGSLVILAAVVILFLADRARPTAASSSRSRSLNKPSAASTSELKAFALASVAGVLLAGSAAFAHYGTTGELGVAPYAALVLASLAALLPTLAAVFFLFNFPLQGARLRATDYFATRIPQHAIGLLSGMILSAGLLGCFLMKSAPAQANANPAIPVYASLSSFVLAMLWGLLFLREPDAVKTRTRLFAGAAAALALGIYFVGFAIAN